MTESERKRSKVIFEEEITMNTPDVYANLKLTVENISQLGEIELQKKFLKLWESIEKIVRLEECPVYIDTSDTMETEPTEQELKEFKEKCLYCIGKDEETGVVEVRPMNEENCIKLHGAEWVKCFIKQLEEFIEE